jgi:alpha-tubulin suppressor-like RCC1 family protein
MGLVSACSGGQPDSADGSGGLATGSLVQRIGGACTGATLTVSPATNATVGDSITLTATASGCAAPEYIFYIEAPDGTYSVGQGYSTTSKFVWDTTGAVAAGYQFVVGVRAGGSSSAYEAYKYGDNVLTLVAPGGCTDATLNVSPATNATVGALITLTASPVGCATAEYAFYALPPGGTWTQLRGYTASSTFPWDTSGAVPGNYQFQVQVRAAGSTAAYEAYKFGAYVLALASAGACSDATLIVSPATNATVGDSITLTASAIGCTGAEYIFYIQAPDGTYSVGQGYSTTSKFVWNTTGAVAGNYQFVVGVRAPGSTAAYEAYKYGDNVLTLVAPGGCTDATLNVSPATNAMVGALITLTASPVGCGTAEYAFYALPPGGTWTQLRGYTTSSTFAWDTSGAVPGNYQFQVQVRAAGSTAAYEAYKFGAYVLSLTPYTAATSSATFAPGQFHTCLRRADGTVDCWGDDQQGQIGIGVVASAANPTAVSGLSGITGVGAGYTHSCAVLGGGTAQCWGSNTRGQLGDGTYTNASTPVSVAGLSGVVSVTGGAAHTCAVISDNTARCWGYNSQGQLGDGSLVADSTAPVTVAGLSGVVALSAGYYHTCALLSDGTVRCWGANLNGQLGDGTTTKSMTPVSVTGLKYVRSIGSANVYNCAMLNNGGVSCWGRNGYAPDSSVPVAVAGITTATSISVGPGHACATLQDGTVRCWGSNSSGELGDGTTTASVGPVTVGGLSQPTAVEVVAAQSHSCVRFADNTASCWGLNGQRELGNGAVADSLTPVAVSLP